MTFSFTELLSPARLALDLTAADGEDAIRATVALLARDPAVVSAERLTAEILEREKLSPTAIGHGVAFPHARTSQVRELVMAIGRSLRGVVFPGADDRIHFFFVIGAPPDRASQYLALVARLARLLKEEAVRARLMAASLPTDFLDVLATGG